MEDLQQTRGGILKPGLVATLFLAGAFVVLASVIWLQGFYMHVEAQDVAAKEATLGPRERGKVLAEQRAQISGYRWVDKAAGTVAIPIERAMELTVREASQGGKGR